jgi:hypothetical protein
VLGDVPVVSRSTRSTCRVAQSAHSRRSTAASAAAWSGGADGDGHVVECSAQVAGDRHRRAHTRAGAATATSATTASSTAGQLDHAHSGSPPISGGNNRSVCVAASSSWTGVRAGAGPGSRSLRGGSGPRAGRPTRPAAACHDKTRPGSAWPTSSLAKMTMRGAKATLVEHVG